jgi:DNA-binding transcriptional LysR family regulator
MAAVGGQLGAPLRTPDIQCPTYGFLMPSIKQLEAFVAVLEAGSFEGAARRLNATPPAVSKRISELESELGVRLFERTTRSCHITLRGRALVPFAQRVASDVGDIQRTVGASSSLTGHIRLGVPEIIGYTHLPEILRKVSTNLPHLIVEVEIGASGDLLPKVRTRALDIACVVGPVLEKDLVSEPFWEVPMSWIAPGPKWTEKPLTIDELAQQTILLPATGRHIPAIEGWFKRTGVRAKQIIICNSQSTVVKMTAIGMGMGFVPVECARLELEARVVTLVPVQVQLPKNLYVTIYPVGQVEPAVGAIIDVMRELAATLMTG